jgi:putative phosphoribosyl transferase
MRALFRDRQEGGKKLAGRLEAHAGGSDVVVLGIPRGGVFVAFEVARHLGVSLDVFVVRKLTVGEDRAAIGAIASGGVTVLEEQVIEALGLSREALDRQVVEELLEVDQHEALFRGGRAALSIRGRTVLLVDDSLSSGPTLRAAVSGVRMYEPRRIILAAPIEVPSTFEYVGPHADGIAFVEPARPMLSSGAWYADASVPSDDMIRALLAIADAKRFERVNFPQSPHYPRYPHR